MKVRFFLPFAAVLLAVSCSLPGSVSRMLPGFESGSSDTVTTPFDPETSDIATGALAVSREAEYVSPADSGALAKFPGPANFVIPSRALSLPVPGNESKIYFGSGNADSAGPVFKPEYLLDIRLASDVQRLEFGWSGDWKTKFAKDFQPWSGSYSYSISAKDGNLRSGKNRYLVRAYRSGGVVTERIFTLEYVNPTSYSTVTMRRLPDSELDKIADGEAEVSVSSYSRTDRDGAQVYRLSLLRHEFGKQTLVLGGRVTFIYELSKSGSLTDSGAIDDPESRFRPKFWIEDTGRASNAVEGVSLVSENFSIPEVRLYPNDRIVIATGAGHEGESLEFFYEPTTNRLSRVLEDFVEPATGSGAYPFYFVDPTGPDLIVREYAYCCDNPYNPRGNELLTFDVRTLALKSRSPVAPLKPDEWGKESVPASFENANFRSEDWGFDLVVNGSGSEVRYHVTNPDKIDEANAGKSQSARSLSFPKVVGKVFSGKYFEIEAVE